MNDYVRKIITEENIQVCLVKQFKLRDRWGQMTSSFFFFQAIFLNVNKPPVHHNFYFFWKNKYDFHKTEITRRKRILQIDSLSTQNPLAGRYLIMLFSHFLFVTIQMPFLTGSTPSCSVIGDLIGDNWFDCLLNLIHLRIWLTTPFQSRSYMTSHIMAGRSKKNIYIYTYRVIWYVLSLALNRIFDMQMAI